MDARDRFLAVMDFEMVAPPKWEFGYWAATLRRWYSEGLESSSPLPDTWPDGVGVHGGAAGWRQGRPLDTDVRNACNLDEGLQRIPLNNYVYPPFPEDVIETHDDWLVVRNTQGIVERRSRSLNSLPSFIQGPVRTLGDWEQFRCERLRVSLDGRLPHNWNELKKEYANRTYPFAVGGGQGFFGTPRFLFGDMGVLTAFHDWPELMHTIIDDLAEFWVGLYGQLLDEVDVDLALIWEDMCFNQGPLISPATFREFLLPGYLRLTRFLRERGVKHVLVDTDGNVWRLLPLFVEGGVTGLYPFEVRAGMDVKKVRGEFPRLQILGGIDKYLLSSSSVTMRSELESLVPWMLNCGGYIPFVDHFVPPSVTWTEFREYRHVLNELLE